MAPEILLGWDFSESIDVFSLGVIVSPYEEGAVLDVLTASLSVCRDHQSYFGRKWKGVHSEHGP
jgi:hypothetical protein